MTDETASVRLQGVVDAMEDDYKPIIRSPFEPEIFEVVPKRLVVAT